MILKYVPYLYMILAVSILPILNILSIQFLHHFLLFMATILLVLVAKKGFKKHELYVLVYVGALACTSIISIFLGEYERRLVYEAFFVYAGAPLFWMLFLKKYRHFNLHSYNKFIVGLALVVSILGFVQFFGDRLIYGLIPHREVYDIDFTQRSLVMHGRHFGVRSVLVSQQVFGLFSALSFLLFLKLNKNNIVRFLLVGIPIILASMLSGQRMVLFVYVAFFFLLTSAKLKTSPYKALFVVLSAIIGIFVFQNIVNHFLTGQNMAQSRVFDIVSNTDNFVRQEREGRLAHYQKLIKEANIVIGEGIGKTNIGLAEGRRLIASESYFIQLYYEGGILVFAAFLFLMTYSLLRAYLSRKHCYFDWMIILVVFISMVGVHAFLNPVFFAFWGLIINSMNPNRQGTSSPSPTKQLSGNGVCCNSN